MISLKSGLLFLFSLLFAWTANGQDPTLQGKILDSLSGEALIGATVLDLNNPSLGSSSDVNGRFSLKLSKGQHSLRFSYVGYTDKVIKLTIQHDTLIVVKLSPSKIISEEVIISDSRSNDNVLKNEMSRVSLDAQTMRKLPVLFGETDVLKTITLMPGIKSGGEGNTGIYVRGGGPDQNLVLFDNGVVYNAAHLLGFFSVFNGDVVEDVEVIKGGMPAEYGGRLSSIIKVKTRDGDFNKYKNSGGVGLISSRFATEGPIQKGKSSFLVTGRRTYVDVVARPFLPDSLKGNQLYFYDLNGKFSFLLSEKDKLTITAYFGRDAFRYVPPDRGDFNFGVNWGNALATAVYTRQVNSKLSYEASLGYNDFTLGSEVNFDNIIIRVSSGLKDWTLKNEWIYTPNKNSLWKFGAQYIYHTFEPGILNAELDGENDVQSRINNQFAHEGAGYVSLEQKFGTRWQMNAGLRYSFFNQVGPYDQVIYESNGVRTDQIIQYKTGESIAFWDGLEPRLAFNFLINSEQSLKASYTRTFQYLHLATSSAATLPSDLWIPSSARVAPQIADQVALGYFRNFKDNLYEASAEVYYKPMQNQIEFRPGANLFFNQNLEAEIISGQGLSYGVELFFKKRQGKTTGWIGYTWSVSERRFDGLNNGEWFYYRYDRRHDISFVLTQELSDKWDFNFVFVYGTGNIITLPVGRFAYNFGIDLSNQNPSFSILDLYTNANTYRMPAYHRADVSFNYTPSGKENKRFKSSWNFSIYNIYNRKNPYFIYLDADRQTQRVSAKMVYLFPILPSVTWNFKF
ncbi:MAG: TonB-dependent receptor [Bacteroidetes bacterium]|nr:MAG: TonB-dependent receptor [Bacteroidota bacterium]